jgi:site-specific DNA-methyltransferase (cytosine-N4-specific)
MIMPGSLKCPPSNALNALGLPTHKQLLLPLLQVIDEAGGELAPNEAMIRLAAKMGIPPHLRDAAVASGRGKWEGRRRYVWKNRVAWTRLEAVQSNYISSSTRGKWRLTKKAEEDLINIRPGFVLKVYETPDGTALWATAEAAAGLIHDESINLICTSPPYDLLRPKRYGNLQGADFIQWLVNLGREWRRMLVTDGSLVLNLGAAWLPGRPCQSEYQERLLLAFLDELKFSYAQRLTWYCPSKFPTTPWVTKHRIRVNSADEVLFWLGKTPHPYANTRELLRPYSDQHKHRLKTGRFPAQGAPSRIDPRSRGSNKFTDQGGSIPHSVLTMPNSNAADAYLKGCREIGLEPNGARMPAELAEWVIRLTTRAGDIVYDPFMGSNTVGASAEKLGRRWLGNDISLTYAAGSALRFPPHSVGFGQDSFAPFDTC